MKRLFIVAGLLLFASFGAQAQTSTTFSITVSAPPSCVVTIAPNPVSTSGTKLYSGRAGVLNFNVSACSAFSLSTATATWDGASIVLSGSVSAAITAAQATVGTHSFILVIPDPVMALKSPVTLPNGTVGVAYSVNLAQLTGLTGGVPPYTWTLDPTTPLPSGLTLSSNGAVVGTPSGAGSKSVGFSVKDSSALAIHSGVLTWSASLGGPVAVVGYNAYRGDLSGGPTQSSTVRSSRR